MNQVNQSVDKQLAYWRSIAVFSVYRIAIATIFIIAHPSSSSDNWLNINHQLTWQVGTLYLLSAIGLGMMTWFKWPAFNRQVSIQVLTDIALISAMMFASGGVKSGLGLLLVVVVAAASLISEGRLALFYAAIATISLLAEQACEILAWREPYEDYSYVVMLSLSCFATAWIAHTFAGRVRTSESLAEQRGIDLENMSQINALISQEMKDGVLIVDSELRIRHYNQQSLRVLGFSPSKEMIELAPRDSKDKKPLLEDVSPDLAFILQSWMLDAEVDEAMKFLVKGAEYRLRFMSIDHDRRHGAIIFIEDWSQMQAQAQQTKLAALGQLTANMAHEIRNPLSAVSHATQLLQEEGLPVSASQRLLEIISMNVQRMDQMVKDISELNRRNNMQQEHFNIVDFIQEFHEQFCEVEKIPAQGFILNLSEQAQTILFDKRHLNQILWNLCRNGWRHSQQNTASLSLFVNATKDNKTVVLQILDDGPGISAEERVRIFEPFFTTVSTGTGLGLYIARELCEANNANIQYIARDKGALFSIQFKKVQL